ncbi:MAG: right-handed parallel beta-helix repeat-containing protein [Candidatus Rokuibacteriota bacterium]
MRWTGLGGVLLGAGLLWPTSAPALEIGPESNLCAALRAVPPGEELLLRPGEYEGACKIRRGGTREAPLVIRAADPQQKPRIVYHGQSANVLEVRASYVRIDGLLFGPTQSGVDAIRVFGGTGITVENCEFSGLGGIAVVSNHESVTGLSVLRNVITDSHATGMYFGCHEGVKCRVTDLRVEGNFIRKVQAPDPEVGYGLQVKLNSTGVIRDNVIVDTKGPGIMVYGSRDGLTVSVVERNFVMGSRESSGIVLGGGPVIARNNIAAANSEGGITLQDYGHRDLLRGVIVAHNTLYKNREAGIELPREGRLQDAIIVNNAAQGRSDNPVLPKERPGLRLAGNVDCTWAPCFVNPDGLDFSAILGSLLSAPGSMRSEPWAPADDYFGQARGMLPVPGAVEHRGGSIRLAPKP